MLVVQGKSELLSNDILQLTNNIMPIKSKKDLMPIRWISFHPSRGPKVMSPEDFSPVKLVFFFSLLMYMCVLSPR